MHAQTPKTNYRTGGVFLPKARYEQSIRQGRVRVYSTDDVADGILGGVD